MGVFCCKNTETFSLSKLTDYKVPFILSRDSNSSLKQYFPFEQNEKRKKQGPIISFLLKRKIHEEPNRIQSKF